MQGRSHDATGFSRVWSLVLPAWIRVKHLVVGGAISVAAIVCTTLLRLFVWRLFLCWFLQHYRRWKLIFLEWGDVLFEDMFFIW